MKNFKFLLFLIAFTSLLSACSQSIEVDLVDPSFAEITNSQSFKAYTDFRRAQQELIDQYVIFDTDVHYDSKEAQLAALNETIRMAQEKGALVSKIGEYMGTPSLQAIDSKEEASATLINFIQAQDADPKVKENFIELVRFEAVHDVEQLRDNIFQEFPSLEVEQLKEVLQQYRATQVNI